MAATEPLIIGRYALFDEIAAGGMATVHLGRLLGAAGFSRVVAIKRLHPQFAKDAEFVSMFVDEARLAARIRHPNVVPTLDVVRTDEELFLVMEYIAGESLSRLMRSCRDTSRPIPSRVAVSIAAGMLYGLHAAHTAKGERGEALDIVHRDVSPQNAIVGVDGVVRVLDFGVAKARVRLQTTREGQIKGKISYMSPEQLASKGVGPYSDVYAAAVILWEMLAGRRLFEAEDEGGLIMKVISGAEGPPSAHAEVPPGLDEIVMRGLSVATAERYATAREMALALERLLPLASPAEVGEWVEELARVPLSARAERISDIESRSEIRVLPELVTPSSRAAGTGRVEVAPGEPELDDKPTTISHSQLSSISVSRGLAGLAPAGAPRRAPLIAALVALLAGALAVAILLIVRAEPARPPDGPALGASGAVATSGASAPHDAGASAGLDAGGPQSAAPSASPSAVPAPSATQAPKTPTGPRTARPPGTPAGTPAADCNPPYTVTADGVRRIKPQCVK